MIPDAFIQALRDRSNVYATVSARLNLKKQGSGGWVGLCPFHAEKSPSFTVNERRNTYHCFGCGAHGSALSFLMEYDGLPFREAIKYLAADCGMTLPGAEAGAHALVDTKRLYPVMELAAKYFRRGLIQSPEALAYLKNRGLNKASLLRYTIGYAPAGWSRLREAFPDYEENHLLEQLGLVKVKEAADDPQKTSHQRAKRYDVFRDRITFAIKDSRGRICAFGGRSIQAENEPKYLNSPESPIFDKSSSFFGLFEAKQSIRQKRELIVVEGYMDVVMLAQHGVENVVASMGTAFTSLHMERALSHAERIIFAFDGDAAGQAAAWKALQTSASLLKDHSDIRFLLIPDRQDPDEYVQKHGKAAFEHLCKAAPTLSEFLTSTLQAKHHGLVTVEDRARFAAEAIAIAEKIPHSNQLRRLLQAHIHEVAKLPASSGSSARVSKPLMVVRSKASVWERLTQACSICPSQALAQRGDLLRLLNDDCDEEMPLLAVLRTLGPESLDQREHPEYRISMDTLAAASSIIAEHRRVEHREVIEERFRKGNLTEREYMNAILALGG